MDHPFQVVELCGTLIQKPSVNSQAKIDVYSLMVCKYIYDQASSKQKLEVESHLFERNTANKVTFELDV